MNSSLINSFILGDLTRDFIVKSPSETYLDIPGGAALYAAGGFLLWGEKPGILAPVPQDYPQSWIEDFSARGINTQGIQSTAENQDARRFYGFREDNEVQTENPISFFTALGLSLPNALLGYQPVKVTLDNRTESAPKFCRLSDIPHPYLDCSSAHFCAMDFTSQKYLPDALRQGQVTTISMQASATYMDPLFLDQIPFLINHLSVYHIAEHKLRALFRNRSRDLWEMLEALSISSCELFLIHRENQTTYLYNALNHERWIIPAYPLTDHNPIGVEEAYSGGFLANYKKNFDPIEAAVHGAISASFARQGYGPFYGLDAYPGLALARVDSLREGVRKL